MVKEDITPPISAKNNIYTVNKTNKSQAYNKTVHAPKINKNYKVKSIDKSRSDQRTYTENTVDKSSSIPRTNLFTKSTRIEKPSEIDIYSDNLRVSVLSGQGKRLSSVSPNIIFFLARIKERKIHTFRSFKNNLLKNHSTQGKGKNKIL